VPRLAHLGGGTQGKALIYIAPPVRALPTRLPGPILIEPAVHGDERGFFQETYGRSTFAELGIKDQFLQDNHSRSGQGIVRGMHFQPGMAKLVRCARRVICDVVVDIRVGSPQFGQWEGVRAERRQPPSALLPRWLRPRILRPHRGR
jgi:dTDP-4-dehydrorhamnose 3,5-epimerase